MNYRIRLKNIKVLKYTTALKYSILCVCLSLILLLNTMTVSANVFNTTRVLRTLTNTKVSDILGYVGKVTGRVNVRVAAGEKNDQLVHNKEVIRLYEGDEVVILSEEMVGKKPWYQVSFTKDSVELTGYATSTYIKKTSTVVTPVPTATPEPTATPTPTPEPTLTPVPTEQPLPTSAPKDAETEGKGNNKGIYIAVISIAFVGIVAIGAAMYHKKKGGDTDPSEILSKKVEQLKHMKLDKNEPISTKSEVKRQPEVKVSVTKKEPEVRDSVTKKEPQVRKNTTDINIRLKNQSVSEEFAATAESVINNEATLVVGKVHGSDDELENNGKESEEKKLLREAVMKLREHDIVIHKYFGRGEVYDNSDVRLIEVRFGGDARFLNKESLITKKLLTITNERRI